MVEQPQHFIPYSLLWSGAVLLVSAVGSLLGFIIKRAAESMKVSWDVAVAKLDLIEQTTRVQAENHLATIQSEAQKQTATMEKQTGLLEELIKTQGETNGFLRAYLELKK